MSSGDTVFEANSLTVVKSLSGKGPDRKHFLYSGNGYEAGLVGTDVNSRQCYLNDLVVQDATSPFDPTKTYDVIIKEH